jgi:hypothetical protein
MEEFKDGTLTISYSLGVRISKEDLDTFLQVWPLWNDAFIEKVKSSDFYMYGCRKNFKQWPTDEERNRLDEIVRELGKGLEKDMAMLKLVKVIVQQILSKK